MPTLNVTSTDAKICALRDLLTGLKRVVVCFSGGVDSGYLLAESVQQLGDRAVALTAVSPSLAPEEHTSAVQLARQLGATHRIIETTELDDARYSANPTNRCYFCKTEVYGVAIAEAKRLGTAHVVDGFNADDRGDHRPGRRAAQEQGVRSPLEELGFGKADIRQAARQLGLPIWDKPALACLSSRFPYGITITPDRLKRVARCEQTLRNLGFPVCRVRFQHEVAQIEVETKEIDRLLRPDIRQQILLSFRDAGFKSVTFDPRGYRQGSLNEGITIPKKSNTDQGVSNEPVPL
ncbi:MAG: TIGR00268 family protein [Acidobacteria bacterium]|nr:TIGR00268 family protein [Acidobacteriota bacterium]|tara:strand:- start:1949 stop:2827 length:879 start_codon:yes stop_codon:yes gene_type:complete